jgi:hypothetical protein
MATANHKHCCKVLMIVLVGLVVWNYLLLHTCMLGSILLTGTLPVTTDLQDSATGQIKQALSPSPLVTIHCTVPPGSDQLAGLIRA